MIPVNLKIRGINSYQKEYEIDFTKLVEGQLFGIFGPVGSGKSTILEAISLALYGETERLNARDDRNYNLMNLQSDELLIDFTFKIDADNQFYRFQIQGKRNSKNFDKVNTFERSAYKRDKEEWRPIPATSAESIIGLSYQNFRRTVIIPQGKFQEFLQLGAKDRTQMLKEIFGLERFDLFDKVASLDRRSKLKKEHLDGQISQYNHLNQETLREKQAELDYLNKELEAQEKVLSQMQALKSRLDKFLDIKKQALRNEKTQDALKIELTSTEKALQSQKVNFEAIQKQFNTLDQLKGKKRELRSIKTINVNKRESLEIEGRLKKGKSILEQTQEEGKQLAKSLKLKEEALKKLRQDRPNLKELSDMKIWFKEKERKLQQISEIERDNQELEKEIQKISREALAPLSDHLLSDSAAVAATSDLSGVETLFDKKRKSLKQGLEKLNEEESNWKVQVGLGDFAAQLSDGNPCPLCGATHHPDLHDAAKAKSALHQVQVKIKKVQSGIEELDQILNDFGRTKIRLEEKQKLLELNKEKIDRAGNAFKQFLKSFIWESFGPEGEQGLAKALEDAALFQNRLDKAEQELDTTRLKLEANRKTMEKYQDGIKEIREKQLRLETESSTLEKGLAILELKDYVQDTEANLNQHIYDLDNEIKDIEFNFKKAENQLLQLEKRRSNLIGEQKILVQNGLELSQSLKVEQEALAQISTSQKEAESILQSVQKNQQEGLEEKIAVFYSSLNEAAQRFKIKREEQLRLDTEVKRLAQDLEKKIKLEAALQQLNNRLEHLKLLRNLFKGSGFVDYISSIYLQELCEAANQRFYKLTRQQLKLEITDKNAFVVRDYLNQGRTRSAKTLSGGQIFQAALSLALALAESIRLQSKSRQNFFFMDEGFGSQDQEALQLVLNTLKSLRKEDRVVGIISHVEELKREIDVFLSIENKEEAGSHISNSWD